VRQADADHAEAGVLDPSFGPPARDINAPNTFGTITSTVSTARTVELVVKCYF
jgi:hypothetical protein